MVVLLCATTTLSAQQLQPLFALPSREYGKGLEFGVDKITNTFVWTGNADVDVDTDFGTFRIVNQYRSSAFRTAATATRDDQQSQVSWTTPISTTLNAFMRQGWLLSQDSRSIGLNSLQRVNGAIGISYAPNPQTSLEGFAGLESSSQLGMNATGPLAAFRGRLDDYTVDEWRMSGLAVADYQKLDDRRTNTDVDASASFTRMLDEGTGLRFSAQTTRRGRQFYTNVASGQPLNVEQRQENILQLSTDITYVIIPALKIGFTGSLLSNSVDRSFDTPMQNLNLTSVRRQLNELNFDVEAHADVTLGQFTGSISGSLFQRSEQNGVQDVFGLPAIALQAVRSQEFQRDNETFRTRMLARAELRVGPTDTLRADISGWLLRYDTPSTLNDDDRDELATIATVSWARRISSVLSMNLAVSGQALHLVFLKATRSAFNNYNRVLRLSPSFVLSGPRLRIQPQFEILANYTAYDYDGSTSAARSFSFRQVSYRDSLRYHLTPSLRAESQVLLRYFERASFQWNAFSETPETGNLEYLLKFLLATDVTPLVSVASGIRLYTLDQRSIAPGVPQLLTGSLHSIGPEISLKYLTHGGSSLSLSGWYEFQTINVTQTRNLPNMLLRCIVRL